MDLEDAEVMNLIQAYGDILAETPIFDAKIGYSSQRDSSQRDSSQRDSSQGGRGFELKQYYRSLELYCRCNSRWVFPLTSEILVLQVQHLLFSVLQECFELRNNMQSLTFHDIHAISIVTEICSRHSARRRADLLIRFGLLIMRLAMYKQMLTNGVTGKDLLAPIRNEEYNVDPDILKGIDVTSIQICLGDPKTKLSSIKILLSILHDAFVRELDDVFLDTDTLYRWCQVETPALLEEKISIPLIRLLFIARYSPS